MKTIIKFYAAMVVLHASLPAVGTPLQEIPKYGVKGGPSMGDYARVADIPEPAVKLKKEPAVIKNDSSFLTERDTSFNRIDTKIKIAAVKLKQNTASLQAYLKDNAFNTEYCFMIDMSIPSGKNRFFVYNIKQDEIVLSSLVSHGSGSYFPGCNDELLFSNMPNSNATSLGKYKIGSAYDGKYGLSYKLYGLDSSNSNAFKRAIVLHSDNYVPTTETYPRHIYESAGCPAVSPGILTTLGKYIKSSDKPVLLWIYK